MRPLRSIIWACLLLATLSHQPAAALSSLFDHQTMMPTAEIRRGMKAVGKTVFQGVEITDFSLEILGILEKADMGYDIILARVLDGPIIQRQTGIIAGMSGSPVYINGRLIGAIAYRWAFEREPLAGITCIDAMLQAFEKEDGTQQAEVAARGAMVEGRYVTNMQVVTGQSPVKFVDGNALAMRPVAPLVSCAGFSRNTMKYLRDFFGDYDLKPVAGPGALRNPVDTEIVPGAALGIPLVTGDFDMSVTGTATYRHGDRVLAFGHPMMELGQTQMPITTAWVHDIMPGVDFSYRFASPMKQVGAMTYDANWSVAAMVGEPPPMIPAVFEIRDEDTHTTRTFHLQVANNKALTSFLFTLCALSAIEAGYEAGYEGMVEIGFAVEGDKGAQISRRNISYYHDDPTFVVVGEIMSAIAILQENRFAPQQITTLRLDAALNRQDQTAFIEQIYAEEPVARAGEAVTLHVLLRPDSGQLVDKTVRLPMPLDLPKGRLRIAVGGGDMAWMLRARLGLLLPEFTDLRSVIKEFEAQERNDQLFAAAALPTRSVRVGPVRMNNIPQSLRDILARVPGTDVAVGYSELSKAIDTPWAIYGSASLLLPTEDRTGARADITVPTKPRLKVPEVGEASVPEGARSHQAIPASLWWATSAFGPQMAASLRTVASAGLWQRTNPATQAEEQPETPPVSEVPEGDEEDDEEEEEKAPEESEGKVGRQPSVWNQSSAADFEDGEMAGVGIRSDGSLLLTPCWETVGRLTNKLMLSMAADAHSNLLIGTSGGRIYRYIDQQLEIYYETNEFAVTALASDADGTIYAGTAAEGKIFVLTSDDEGRLLCELPADYIWDLQLTADGGLFAATGPQGIIYQVDKEGQFSVYADLPQSHILALAQDDASLFAGTSEPGCVYKITEPGRAVSLLETEDNDITALVISQSGEVYAASAPQGYIYKITKDANPQKVYADKENGIYALLAVGSRVYGGSEPKGKIISVLDEQQYATVHQDDQDGQVLSMTAAGGVIYAGGANPALLLSASANALASGSFTSSILDAERTSQWGRIQWWSQAGPGCQITVQCRSGNTTDSDDGTWSVWSRPYENHEYIDVPAARYLQYRARIEPPEDDTIPRVDRIVITYLPANQRPTLTVKEPEEGTALRETAEVNWKGKDPDDDTLAATIYLRAAGQPEWEKIAGPLQEDSYELDTAAHDAGHYDLKVIISDEPSNPQSPRTDEAVLRGLIIDNESPSLRVGPLTDQGDRTVLITGSASDDDSGIAGVSWQADGDENWFGAGAADGIYDENFERFTIRATDLPEEASNMLIRARDRAGNVTDETVELP